MTLIFSYQVHGSWDCCTAVESLLWQERGERRGGGGGVRSEKGLVHYLYFSRRSLFCSRNKKYDFFCGLYIFPGRKKNSLSKEKHPKVFLGIFFQFLKGFFFSGKWKGGYKTLSTLRLETFKNHHTEEKCASYLNINKTEVIILTKRSISQKPNIKHRVTLVIHKGLVSPDVHCMVSLRLRTNVNLKLAFRISGSLQKQQIVDLSGMLRIQYYFVDHSIDKKNQS